MSLSLSYKMSPPAQQRDILRSRRGISLLEVVIAMFLTTIAVMAVMSLQPAAWKTAGRADYMGRAAGILHKELQTQEACIMNSNNTVPATGNPTTRTVFAGGGTSAQASGDAQFTVATTITSIATNVWRVTVRVTWTGNATGISESLVVTRQQAFSNCTTCSAGTCQ